MRHEIFRENDRLPSGRLVLPGAIKLYKDRIPLIYNYRFEELHFGWVSDLQREGNVVTVDIEVFDRYKELLYKKKTDGTYEFLSDLFEFSGYAIRIMGDVGRKGSLIVSSGELAAVSIVPIQSIPKGLLS